MDVKEIRKNFTHYCSFCGQYVHDTEIKLIVGPEVSICEDCIISAARQLVEMKSKD